MSTSVVLQRSFNMSRAPRNGGDQHDDHHHGRHQGKAPVKTAVATVDDAPAPEDASATEAPTAILEKKYSEPEAPSHGQRRPF